MSEGRAFERQIKEQGKNKVRRVTYYRDFSLDGKKYWGYRIRYDGTHEESYGFWTKLAAMRDYRKHYKEDRR